MRNQGGPTMGFDRIRKTVMCGGMKRKPTLWDPYRFAGCRPQAHLKGVWIYLEVEVRRVMCCRCGKVKAEQIE